MTLSSFLICAGISFTSALNNCCRAWRQNAGFPLGRHLTGCGVSHFVLEPALSLASRRIVDALLPNGVLVLLHWTPVVADYPLTGDAVHEHFLQRCSFERPMRWISNHREPTYRIDVMEKADCSAS